MFSESKYESLSVLGVFFILTYGMYHTVYTCLTHDSNEVFD